MSSTVAEFPDTYTDIPTALLISAYGAGPARLRTALADLDGYALSARPRPGKWSIREIALHLTDSELVGVGRIRLTFAQPGAAYYVYDENIWARAHAYQEADAPAVERPVSLFQSLRAATLPLSAAATSVQWRHAGLHPERGTVTLRNLLELYADHSERHLEQILECRRRIGAPVELIPILERRLY